MKKVVSKSLMPTFVKRIAKQGLKLYRTLTSQARLMPDFIIIGAQKGGTTSLFNYLVRHPYILPPLNKEIHFFDLNFGKGVAWYRAHFPSIFCKHYVKRMRKGDLITGEATPNYMFHPSAPKRILETTPQAQLVAILRNPVDRAYSHYHMTVRKGYETLSFEDALDAEEERLRGEREKIIRNEDYYSLSYWRHSYLSRGIYVDQLRAWMSLFPKEQILILKSEDLLTDPPMVLMRVFEFLDLPNWEMKEYRRHYSGNYSKMDASTRKRLVDFFESHNQRLYRYLGMDFGWDR